MTDAERIAELEAELERERLRLAACGVAALGYFDGCADEYKSASLDDVLTLYVQAEQLREEVVKANRYAAECLKRADQLDALVEAIRAASIWCADCPVVEKP